MFSNYLRVVALSILALSPLYSLKSADPDPQGQQQGLGQTGFSPYASGQGQSPYAPQYGPGTGQGPQGFGTFDPSREEAPEPFLYQQGTEPQTFGEYPTSTGQPQWAPQYREYTPQPQPPFRYSSEPVSKEKQKQEAPKYSIYSRKASENPDTVLFVAPDPKTNKPAVFLTADPKGGYWSAFPAEEMQRVPEGATTIKLTTGPLAKTKLYIVRIPAQEASKEYSQKETGKETMWLPIDDLSPMAAISRPLSSGKKSFVDPTLQNVIKANAAKIKSVAMSKEASSKQKTEPGRDIEKL